jgi:hypothetical protein
VKSDTVLEDAHGLLVGKHLGKLPLRKPKRRREADIGDHIEVGYDNVK